MHDNPLHHRLGDLQLTILEALWQRGAWAVADGSSFGSGAASDAWFMLLLAG